ncbi:glycerophosphodiester phosphodiesterase family protein [Nodosilinea sp. PGN35]|uniref:glycerophosphodiester phosphodiesterase family protein n=1 Tax=Nodosilinea sp. PGN35 TaxID=3020489 RepID=UPI0023B27908|nr:glycerophosphodiester phosphodiesterase family protein [Nodosilinea sp. TSF1-S3]MDF0368319.1 glycerophosphodiester phosphodiesterase family protein [Nodosilinea sp. TSF1-S3]
MAWITAQPIAHRGLHQGAVVPENSLAAFEAAIAAHHPIELDVQLLADGHLAVFHDRDLKRLTGQKKRIADQTLATLKQYRLYATDQSIPLLAEVLALVNGQVPLLIEIKNEKKVGPPEQALVKTLAGYRGEFAVQSFNPRSLQWFKRYAPDIPRGQLASKPQQFLRSHLLLTWASAPHFISYNVKALPTLPTTLARRYFQLPLLAWTVRSQTDCDRAIMHADNYIFDRF